MKSILLPIKPIFVERILSGEKWYEFRKRLPLDIERVVIYETAPTKKVVGEFHCKRVICAPKEKLWQFTFKGAGIDKSFFDSYFSNVEKGMAIEIETPISYDSPIDLRDIGVEFTPQSWIYIK